MLDYGEEWARQRDHDDPLSAFRDEFFLPQDGNGRTQIYLCGNSLGLQPKSVPGIVAGSLSEWQMRAVEGWFEGDSPWLDLENRVRTKLPALTGASFRELTVMNSLTVNLHLLFTSFYRPEPRRYKVLMEAHAFPSDQYLVKSQAKLYGFDDAIIDVRPAAGEIFLRTGDILDAIDRHRDELALIFFSGVNYFSGQVFDLEAIAAKAVEYQIPIGLDLAHAIGNVPLSLHDWNIDFAAWCSYKYLNSGPGGIGGIFVHEKHHTGNHLRLEGWWGNERSSRFRMAPEFAGAEGAESWQISTSPVLQLAVHDAALDITNRAGMERLREKSKALTGYLAILLGEISSGFPGALRMLSPENPDERGCQLSLRFAAQGRRVFDELVSAGIIGDWREPNVIRLSPVPLYNTFLDVYKTAQTIREILLRFA